MWNQFKFNEKDQRYWCSFRVLFNLADFFIFRKKKKMSKETLIEQIIILKVLSVN